ncbi:MAG: F0F1 ATP synthase subunit B [Prevotellaceae bacterium]|jgi:F-type H+-transporting ATPase subunit b|nr:F0F1 ATP synthase subunit B [Prevotellaceae bacterium]
MSLLLPETGLLFWMLLAFGVVFFVLAKFGWPVILGMVEERSDFINSSVRVAEEAHRQLENIKATSDNIVAEARKKQLDILQEAAVLKNKMLDDAKAQAVQEADKVARQARQAIQKEKDDALKEIRKEVAALSLGVAEKVLRQKLANEGEEAHLVEKLLDEMEVNN